MSFLFFAIGVTIIISALRRNRERDRDLPAPREPVLLEDPRVARMQAEVEELRSEVRRLAASESFRQLQPPARSTEHAGA
jgi:hypothetical protein